MAFTADMRASARRHLNAAEELNGGHRRDVAGYLYGIAAECAIKAMMLDIGLRPGASRSGDPFYLHFPDLRTFLLDRLTGRLAVPLSQFVTDGRFMSNWAIEMRYSKGEEILDRWVDIWSEQARQAVSAIGT